METLESSRVCRLCGKQSGISINIFDKNDNHVKKINAVLPIMVHEMDLLPKHMCHRCSYKLEEFHKFYIDCLKTDANLKSQLSWMRKEHSNERIGVPMVQIENLKIKEEPPDYDCYELDSLVDDNVNYMSSIDSISFPVKRGRTNGIAYTTYAPCSCPCVESSRKEPLSTDYKKSETPSSRSAEASSVAHKLGNRVTRGFSNSIRAEDSTPRNLRPRKVSFEYTLSSTKGKKKKTSPPGILDVSRVKLEQNPEAPRVLRPRKRTIDYLEPKRRYSSRNLPLAVREESNFNFRLGDELDRVKREAPSDREESTPPPTAARKITTNSRKGILDSLSDCRLVDKRKKNTSRGRPSRKSERICLAKFLRSRDLFLRNGKARRIENDRPPKRTISDTSSANKPPSSFKFNNNVKRYCDECDSSFASKELYMLHACYV